MELTARTARIARVCAAALAIALLGGCSALGAFDAIVAKDTGVTTVASNQPFGPDKRQRVDVYAPRDTPASARLPVIVFFYGGSWNSGDKSSYDFTGRALAAQGFVVAIPNYRLLPKHPYPTFLQDSAAAVHWVRANAARLGGDPDRIVLAGHSAGAYNAAMLAFDPQWLDGDRQAVKGFAGLAGPYAFLPLDTQVTIDTFGKVADLPSTQPVHFASKDDPPALLMAGGKDQLVFASNSVGMAMALSEAGVPVETRVYDELGHVGIMSALAKPFRGKGPVLADLTAFARRVTAAPGTSAAR